jgi:hypothetical protein
MAVAAVISALARSFLAGEVAAEGVRELGARTLGRNWRWLRSLARRYVAAFDGRTRPRHRDGTIEFEPGLEGDLPEILDKLMPPSRAYGHEQAWHDGNGHSHLQATLLGPSLTVPVGGGRAMLGTWQQVFLLECDVRPRERTVVITVTGD